MLSITLLTATTFSTISCDSRIDEESVGGKDLLSVSSATGQPNYMNIVSQILSDENLNNMTQSDIDKYLLQMGHKSGDITVSQVQDIIEEIMSFKENHETGFSYDDVLNLYDTKMHPFITELLQGKLIDDKFKSSEFIALSSSQQEQLVFLNDFMSDYLDSISSNSTHYTTASYNNPHNPGTTNEIPCPSVGCTVAWTLIGAGIGSIGGPVGAGVGALVGFLVGAISKEAS